MHSQRFYGGGCAAFAHVFTRPLCRYQMMPILTPAYPSMNSSFNVSTHTLTVMKEEFKRALDIVQDILNKGGVDWAPLFEPSDFFAVHQHYLAVDVYTEAEDEEQAWCGFCESRIRKLVESLAYIPQLCRIRTFTKKYPLSFVDTQSASATKEGQGPSAAAAKPTKFGVCFFVGFDIDRSQLRGREVSIDNSVDYFKHNDLYRWNKRTPTMDVKITPVVWKNLPECVFEDMGDRQVARSIRREFMKKKKDEAKDVEAAASASANGTSSGDDAAKDTQSQDTDGTVEDGDASATEELPLVAEDDDTSSGKQGGQEPGSQSPNPAVDGSDSSSACQAEADLSTPVKAKKEEVVGASPEIPGKRDRNGTTSTAGTPIGKASANGVAPGTPSTSTASGTSLAAKAVKTQQQPPPTVASHKVPAPAAISSPRKRRKMKITFAKLN